MKGKFLLALLLGAGVAVAQAQEQQPGMPSSAPNNSPTGTTNDQTTGKAKQQAPIDQTENHTASSGTVAPTSTSVKGCLKQTGGGWTLVSDSGNTINVTGDDSTLKPHDAQQVEIMGTQANDGSIQATSVNMIANSCPSQSGSTASSAAPVGTEQPAAGNTAQNTSQSSMTQQTQQTTSTTTASAPVTNQTPATTVGTGSTAANGTAASMNGQNAAQTPATSPAASAPDQSAMQQNPSATTTDQNSASTSTSSMNANDNANNNQNATANTDKDNTAGAGQKLPQTASPLPLLGLLGLGSLAGGFFARRKK